MKLTLTGGEELIQVVESRIRIIAAVHRALQPNKNQFTQKKGETQSTNKTYQFTLNFTKRSIRVGPF